MRKNAILVILIALTVGSGIYANRKANEAALMKASALENQVIALEHQSQAQAQSQKATKAAAESLVAQRKANALQRALEVCE